MHCVRYRYELLRAEEQLRQRPYARVIVSRLDYVWLAPGHPPLASLAEGCAWIPNVEDYGGLNDRHAVLSRAHAHAYLGRWRMLMDGSLMALHPQLKRGTASGLSGERSLAALLFALNVPVCRFAPTAFLACCTASSSSTGGHAPSRCHNPRCTRVRVSKTHLPASSFMSDASIDARGKYVGEVRASVLHAFALRLPGAHWAEMSLPASSNAVRLLGIRAASVLALTFNETIRTALRGRGMGHAMIAWEGAESARRADSEGDAGRDAARAVGRRGAGRKLAERRRLKLVPQGANPHHRPPPRGPIGSARAPSTCQSRRCADMPGGPVAIFSLQSHWQGEFFLEGASALGWSLHRFAKRVPRFIFHPETTPPPLSAATRLHAVGWRVCGMAAVRPPSSLHRSASARWPAGYSKFHLFRLVQFERILYLDGDTLAVRSLAPLLGHPMTTPIAKTSDGSSGVRSPIHVTPHLGAAPDLDPIRLTPRHDSFSFNLGVLLLRPNESLATALFAFMAPAAHNSTLMEQRYGRFWNDGESPLLIEFYRRHRMPRTVLSWAYNVSTQGSHTVHALPLHSASDSAITDSRALCAAGQHCAAWPAS